MHPGVWPYINFFPNYADASQLGTKTYDEYVEKFIEVCHPPILSYDHYAIMEGGGLRGEYFANLESIRRAAVKHKLPFWQIVLSVGCLNYREPSATDMRFQVYTSLAYGARGLAYFKYFTPGAGNYRNGPIDQFGHETPMWQIMRQVNLQVGKLAPTLLKLTSDRVYHFGKVPAGCTGPDDQSLVKAMSGNISLANSRIAMAAATSWWSIRILRLRFRAGPNSGSRCPSWNLFLPMTARFRRMRASTFGSAGQGALLKITR